MAEVLEGYTFGDPRRGANYKYPWDNWTDGRVWKAEQGKDFHVPCNSFRAGSLHRAARDRGLKCRARMVGNTVIFQFYKPDGANQ